MEKECFIFSGKKVCQVCGCIDGKCECEIVDEGEQTW